MGYHEPTRNRISSGRLLGEIIPSQTANGGRHTQGLESGFTRRGIAIYTRNSHSKTVQASSLTCIDSNLVFVGSHFGDSQLIQLQPYQTPQGAYFTVQKSFTNLAPIIDFCVVDLEKQGQGQVVTCSGAHKDGSLRIVRNGIGMDEMGELNEVHGVTAIHTLRPFSDSTMDNMLVLSFVAETRFQIMHEGSLEELEDSHGLITHESTLCCANVLTDSLVQVFSL